MEIENLDVVRHRSACGWQACRKSLRQWGMSTRQPAQIVSVDLHYELGTARRSTLSHPLFDVLKAVRDGGSIAEAARSLGWSYRHLWGFLKRQEVSHGRALIMWDKGKAARLSPFADKLLWAETRIQARLAADIENLATEIGRELTVAFNDAVPMATCMASHDLALPLLRQLCETRQGLLMDLRFSGSLDALAALSARRVQFAGMHLPCSRPDLAGPGSPLQQIFAPLLGRGREKLIQVSRRTQGLIVPLGNPARLKSVAHLVRAPFANREVGTGTRALLDAMLSAEGVSPQDIQEYERIEPTHLAVAAAVASGEAQAGFGIEAAARRMGVDFVPLVVEDSFLVCDRVTLEGPVARGLLELLQSQAWHKVLADLPGYDAHEAGTVRTLRRTLPWLAQPPLR
jgi:putative molybdopterin biosynthesis protein